MRRLFFCEKRILALLLAIVTMFCFLPLASAQNQYSDLLIKLDDTGDNVLLLQMRLRDLGYYPYKITGQFGSVTKNAVINFQKGNNLSPDGIVGGQTAELLFNNEAKRVSSSAIRMPTPSPSPTPKRHVRQAD
jgi:peptidoglycan hydrolase-like protein with peptidoglycan-binding domain